MNSSFRGSAPYSEQFDDIYFNPSKGLEESSYVFLEQSSLLDRLQKEEPITVAELGFGTGLNFLTVWDAWKKAGSKQLLHFISFEKFPLPLSTLERLKEEFSCFSENYEQFLRAYPENIEGFHHRQFESGKLQLTLVNGDVHELISSKAQCLVSRWFCSSQNPEMWQLISSNSCPSEVIRELLLVPLQLLLK